MRAHPYAARAVAGTHEWLTPGWIKAPLGEFDLDPCTPSERPWDMAKTHYSLPDRDGLEMRWFGRVWLNPPFGRHAEKWMEKMAAHNNGIALLFARTETKMFSRFVWPVASAVMFLKGRPHFCLPCGQVAKGNSGGPICLIAYGEENVSRLIASRLGYVVRVDKNQREPFP